MRSRLLALTVGVVFGVVLSWSGMTSPDVIRGALLFEDSYLFLFFGSAVATASIGLLLLRRAGRVTWTPERVERRHITGSLTFGIVWGVADACPGMPQEQHLASLSQLLKLASAKHSTHVMMQRINEGTRVFGKQDAVQRRRTVDFLSGAGLVVEAYDFLPSLEDARAAADPELILVHARYKENLAGKEVAGPERLPPPTMTAACADGARRRPGTAAAVPREAPRGNLVRKSGACAA